MQPRDLGRTVVLCVIGGSADAIAFLRYGTFVGAMTGNTVLLGIDLAEGKLDRAGFHLGIVAVFLAAVIVTQTALKARIPPSLPLLLTALMLGGSEFIASAWSAIICAAALGVQNAAVRTIAGVTINTVFITGNLVQLGAAVPAAPEPQRRATIAVLAIAWVAYALGAAAGAAALHLIAYPMIVPAVLALVAALAETKAEVGNPTDARQE
ncbi:MAG: YoaK family protein [Xanthobacteraceae bacterium]